MVRGAHGPDLTSCCAYRDPAAADNSQPRAARTAGFPHCPRLWHLRGKDLDDWSTSRGVGACVAPSAALQARARASLSHRRLRLDVLPVIIVNVDRPVQVPKPTGKRKPRRSRAESRYRECKGYRPGAMEGAVKATRQPKYNLEVMVRDRAYHGIYTVSDAKLELSSAYGSITKPVGSSKPVDVICQMPFAWSRPRKSGRRCSSLCAMFVGPRRGIRRRSILGVEIMRGPPSP